MRVFTCRRPKCWCDPVMFSPDGRYLACFTGAAGRSESTPHLYSWDTTGGNGGGSWPGDGTALAAAGDGVYVTHGFVYCGGDLVIWSCEPESVLPGFHTHTISADGRFALAETHNPKADPGPKWERGRLTLRVARHVSEKWEIVWERSLPFDPVSEPQGFSHLVFSTGGRFVVWVRVVGLPRLVRPVTRTVLLDAETGKTVVERDALLPRPPSKVIAGPTGVLVILKGKTLFVVDPNTPDAKTVKRENATAQHFTAAAFSPDGKRLATVSRDTAVTVWDTATWEFIRQHEWKIGPLRSVAFAPDGLRCAAGSETGEVVVWDLDE